MKQALGPPWTPNEINCLVVRPHADAARGLPPQVGAALQSRPPELTLGAASRRLRVLVHIARDCERCHHPRPSPAPLTRASASVMSNRASAFVTSWPMAVGGLLTHPLVSCSCGVVRAELAICDVAHDIPRAHRLDASRPRVHRSVHRTGKRRRMSSQLAPLPTAA